MPRFRKGADWHAAGREHHWRAVDILAMVIAALGVMLPLVLAVLAAVAAAYGLFMLAFG
jgi:hypothetical protein